MINQNIQIRKNNNLKELKRLKIIINKSNSKFDILVEKYAIDTLTNSIYLKLCFSNVILSFNCGIAYDFLNAILGINDFTKCKIVQTNNKNIKWIDIPYNLEITQDNK